MAPMISFLRSLIMAVTMQMMLFKQIISNRNLDEGENNKLSTHPVPDLTVLQEIDLHPSS